MKKLKERKKTHRIRVILQLRLVILLNSNRWSHTHTHIPTLCNDDEWQITDWSQFFSYNNNNDNKCKSY